MLVAFSFSSVTNSMFYHRITLQLLAEFDAIDSFCLKNFGKNCNEVGVSNPWEMVVPAIITGMFLGS